MDCRVNLYESYREKNKKELMRTLESRRYATRVSVATSVFSRDTKTAKTSESWKKNLTRFLGSTLLSSLLIPCDTVSLRRYFRLFW